MTSVRVGRTRFDGRTARAELTIGDERHELLFRSRQRMPRHALFGDVWLPIALFPAMRTGSPLELADATSPALLSSVREAQDILSSWSPELRPVTVTAPARLPRLGRRRRQLQAFTGGVDSFYSYFRGPAPDALVYLHDLHHDVPEVRARITGFLDQISARLGTPIIHVEYEARSMLDTYADWATQTHGAVFAALSAFVSRGPTDFRLPTTHPYRTMPFPRGSHAALDPLWGNEARRVVHHGGEASRFEKVAALAQHPLAIENLRVCFSTTTEINCSQCEKCVRTMLILDILGLLDRARTFHGEVTEEKLRAHPVTMLSIEYLQGTLEGAVAVGHERAAQMIRAILADARAD